MDKIIQKRYDEICVLLQNSNYETTKHELKAIVDKMKDFSLEFSISQHAELDSISKSITMEYPQSGNPFIKFKENLGKILGEMNKSINGGNIE